MKDILGMLVSGMALMTLGFSWFDGVSLDVGVRTVTASALVGLALVIMWFLEKSLRLSIGFGGVLRVGVKSHYLFILSVVALLIMTAAMRAFGEIVSWHSFQIAAVSWMSLIVLFVVAIDVLSRMSALRVLAGVLLFGALSGILVVGFAVSDDAMRAAGWVSGGNPNYAANRILPVAVMFSYLALFASLTKRSLIWVWVGAFATAGALLLTLSAGAILGFMVVVTVMIAVRFAPSISKRGSHRLVVFAVLGLSVALPTGLFQEVGSRLSGGVAEVRGGVSEGSVASIQQRVERDIETVMRGSEWGLFGVGLGQNRYYLESGVSHNSYLTAWIELGAIGLVLFSVLVLYGALIPASSSYGKAVRWGFVAFAIHIAALGGYPKMLFVLLILRILIRSWELADGGRTSEASKSNPILRRS